MLNALNNAEQNYLFLFFPAEIPVIRNLELANHSISKGVNSDIERRGKCHGSKVEIFLLESLREDMNLLHKNSKKVSTELGNSYLNSEQLA